MEMRNVETREESMIEYALKKIKSSQYGDLKALN
jgi:RNA polymerase-binding transcription factor DksA